MLKKFEYKKQYMGETCLLFTFGSNIDLALSNLITNIYSTLQMIDLEDLKILDIVPSYTQIAVYFNLDSPLLYDDTLLDKTIATESVLNSNIKRNTHIIQTDYNGEDLNDLCSLHNIDRRELIELHSRPLYLIAMLGFKPYFPYLIGLNSRLITPRRNSPRLLTPKGSVAIGGSQTGIYTENSPGGWHIIGQTSFDNFNLFKPGDYIRFVETSYAD